MSNKNMKRISRSLLILMIVLFTFGFVGQGVTYAVDFNIDNTPINGGFNQDIAQTSTATEKGWLESAGDWVSDKWDGFTDWCGELWDDVNNILDDLGAKIQDIMDTAWKWALAIGSAATLAWALLKKQIPALQVVEWAFSFIKGVLRGLADIVMGVFDLVVGALGLIGYIILNPIESGKKLGHWITHPGEVWNNISNMVGGVWNEITESWNRMVVNGDGNSRSEWLGYAATQIVGIFVGTKGLEKAGKAGSVVSKAGGISSRFPLASKAFDAIADSFKGFGDKVKSFGDNLFGNAKRILATTTAGAMLLTGITFVWPKIEPYIMKFSDCIAIQQQDAGHYFASMQLAGKIDCPSGKAEENPWIDKPVSGQLKYDSQGQRILTTNEFKRFRDEMAKQDIKVVVDTKEKRLPKNVAAGFDFETKEIILRPDATKVSAIHESYHVKQYIEIGKEKYKQLPAIEREEYVYNEIMKNKSQFNSAEIHESQRVIFKYRNGYWPTENWKGFGE